MGKAERAHFKAELEKLEKIKGPDETPEYYEQNARVAAAEEHISGVENLWVRGQVG